MSKIQYLYSTNASISYDIAQEYYDGIHYVWCAPSLDVNPHQPASSSPEMRYSAILSEVRSNDLHGFYINSIKTGLRNGALKKKDDGVIDDSQYEDILYRIEEAEILMFRPVVYVMHYDAVQHLIVHTKPSERAGVYSQEYRIEKLPRAKFDILKIPYGI